MKHVQLIVQAIFSEDDFGVPCKISDKKWFIRRFTNDEMFHIYYIPIGNDNSINNAQYGMLDDLLPFSIPWKFRYDIMEDENCSNNMLDYFKLGNSNQCETSKQYFTSKSPVILYWIKAYLNDNNIDMILNNIQKSKNVTWTAAHLKAIRPGYKTSLKEVIIQTLHAKLVLYNPILENHRYVSFTIVPQSLRRSVFSHFRAGAS